MIPAVRLIDEARLWLGVPFLHQGRSRAGVDCIGLVLVACRGAGVVPPDFDRNGYSRRPMEGLLEREVAERCAAIDQPEPGCVVLIRWTRQVQHIALCTGENLIHSYGSVGRVVEHGYRGAWPRMTHSLWRLPGVDPGAAA